MLTEAVVKRNAATNCRSAGKTSPVAGADVAQVVAAVLADPIPHMGRIYELTGPQSQDMDGIAREFSEALNREITSGEGAENAQVTGASDGAPFDDGRVAPSGSL